MGEESSRERNNDDEYESSSSSTASCGCFMGLCYSWRRPNNGYTKMMRHQNGEEARDNNNKVKGFLGGQNWNKYRFKMKMINKKSRSNKLIFQYDPKSYALNFDDGTHDHYLAFSARYAQHPSPLQAFPNAISYIH